MPKTDYPTIRERQGFYDQLLENLRELPGIRASGITADLPTIDTGRGPITIEGRSTASSEDKLLAATRIVSRGYLNAIGVATIKGRQFDEGDRPDGQKAALINEELARQYFSTDDPIGRRIKNGEADGVSPWFTIVGIVGDTKLLRYGTLEWFSQPELIIEHHQIAGTGLDARTLNMTLVVEGTETSGLTDVVRRAVSTTDKNVPIVVRSMDHVVADQLAQPRLRAILLGGFAVLTLLLASIGLYGVISQSVLRRRREFAIRAAIGAQRRAILWMVAFDGLRLALIGVALGLVGASILMRLLQNFLYGLRATSWTIYALVSLLVLAVSLVASLLPARRATNINLAASLRLE